MNRVTKCVLTVAAIVVALTIIQPQCAEARGVAVYGTGYYHTGFYDPCYTYAYMPAYHAAYRSAYAEPVPYATYYNYRPFYDYVTPSRAWVQPMPAAGGYWTAPAPMSAPYNYR